MIYIHLDSDEFEYDVRSMVKAFYPEAFLYVYCDESKVQQQNKPEGTPFMSLDIKISKGEIRLKTIDLRF